MRKTTMPTYQVIVTRDITTSTILDIVAENKEKAKEEAIIQAWNESNLEWRPNDVDWTKNEPFISDIVEID
jgi:hypothetical protein